MAETKQFLPMTRAEMKARGWDELDVLIITGDAYIDHPAFGAAVIGRVLEADGWRVGIIAQPDWTDVASLTVMGRPRLFCGITAGNLDSMLSHYTAARRKRKEDSYTLGGVVGKRPNLAGMVYTQLAKKAFPGVVTVLGGIEASLRRTAHYDYWQDKLRPFHVGHGHQHPQKRLIGVVGVAVVFGGKSVREGCEVGGKGRGGHLPHS